MTNKDYLELLNQTITQRGGHLLSTYTGYSNKVTVSCGFLSHLPWKVTPSSIARGTWCPHCGSSSVREEICRYIFEEALGKPFEKTRKEKFTGGLELDGYNEDYMLAFEHNGRQHYVIIPYYHGSSDTLEKQQERDKLKSERCTEAGVDLVVIPYTVHIYKLRQFIRDALNELGYLDLLPAIGTETEMYNKIRSRGPYEVQRYNEIKEIVEKGDFPKGKVLSDRYVHSGIKMRFKCNVIKHPEFEMTPATLVSGSWCICCFHDSQKTTTDEYQSRIDPYGWTLLSIKEKPARPKNLKYLFIRHCDTKGHKIYKITSKGLDRHISRFASLNCPNC